MQWIEGVQTFHYENGNIYSGNFKEGLPDGIGTMWYANGNVYLGEWRNGCRHGWGNAKQPGFDGYYHLQYNMGIPFGEGELHYPDGDVEKIRILKFKNGRIYFKSIAE